VTTFPKKVRAQQPLSFCALFKLSRKVSNLPGSIWQRTHR
jgi:hypothetical protein